jgi:hypothetical protein
VGRVVNSDALTKKERFVLMACSAAFARGRESVTAAYIKARGDEAGTEATAKSWSHVLVSLAKKDWLASHSNSMMAAVTYTAGRKLRDRTG